MTAAIRHRRRDIRSTANTHEAELPADQHDPATAGAQPGAWRILEEKTRQWAITPQERAAGDHRPHLHHSDGAIGNGVTVPHAYRVVMDLAGKPGHRLHPAARERLGQSAGGLW